MKFITDPEAARAVQPRPAATTLIVRDAASSGSGRHEREGGSRLEVLMVRRSLQASFMPGAYVFPGGAVDAGDGSALAAEVCDEPVAALVRRIGEVTEVGAQAPAFAVAALRECFEECGLWLGPGAHDAAHDAAAVALRRRLHAGEPLPALAREAGWPLCTSALQPWSRWITPIGLPKRFDTMFFVTAAPSGQVPTVDEGETTTLAWVHPSAALRQHEAGDFQMEFATVNTVRSLVPFANTAALLARAAAQRRLPPVRPRIQFDSEGRRVPPNLLPGDADYDTRGFR